MKFDVFEKVAGIFGTPAFVYFEKTLKERARKVFDVFRGLEILPTVALKANNNPRILRILKGEGFGADVVTPGELVASLKAGVDPVDIVWNGNGKTQGQKEFFMKKGVRMVNVDSIEEYEMLWKWEKGVELFLRINPNVEAHTHEHISTGREEHKFGVPIEKAVYFLKNEGKNFVGLHVHVGSQITDVDVFEKAYSIATELSKEFGFSQINIGGGWGIDYGDGKELDLERYRGVVLKTLGGFERIYLELGRYILGPAGYLLAKVVLVKKGFEKHFVVLDTGMSQLIRPALYDANHEIRFSEYSETEGVYDVVGYLCESGDFLKKNVHGKIPMIGSLAVVENAGAYGYSMSSNYNSVPRPPEVLVRENGSVELIRKGETLEDLFRGVLLDDSIWLN